MTAEKKVIQDYDRVELLRELCTTFGPTGCEDEAAALIRQKIDGFADVIKTDRMGNVIAFIRGGGEQYDAENPRKIMISAHMDEVGFMVNEVTDEGYLKFACLGGIDPRVLCGRNVIFGNETKKIRGFIASKAIHLQSAEDRKTTTTADKMYIDIGAANKEEALGHVKPGDFGTFDSDFVLFGSRDKYVRCKAIDDRLGCAVIVNTLRRFGGTEDRLPYDVYFCFTVREEIGFSGALTAANTIMPDFSIVLESTAIADLPDVPEASRAAKVGEGGVISLADRSTIYDRELVDFAMATAKKYGIAAQIKKYVSGGNDAGHIHKSGRGVRTLALSAPTRYLHSASCVAALSDYDAIEAHVAAMLREWRF